ncbi:hypothetical protein DEU56DRAFT_572086 [Suillus clintonianus]|uniref:uncharacterized protein n=1 Tax=Suillus clintonianus TaxID=1904413 RepID=UPI001B87F291|nr:uncharacterized protein DEU56DRAFT_572086 [Suillus clintonianus]KAG2125366.1 hypothetical protein DEU56DRAFT_572086 [Suillus clintonianus]
MPNNKHRLYIAFYHRTSKPGFHFALILSPKNESRNDYHIYHAINTIKHGIKFNLNGMPQWRFEHKTVNGFRKGTAIGGRVLIAKLPAHEPVVTYAERIHDILAQVPLVQNDAQWDCRVWMIEALAALRAKGGDFSTIPEVTNRDQADGELKRFGDTVRDIALKGRPSGVSDLPHIDMRVR